MMTPAEALLCSVLSFALNTQWDHIELSCLLCVCGCVWREGGLVNQIF